MKDVQHWLQSKHTVRREKEDSLKCVYILNTKTLNYLHNIEDTVDFSSYSILGEAFPYLTENLRKCSLQNVKDYIKYMHETAAQVVKQVVFISSVLKNIWFF